MSAKKSNAGRPIELPSPWGELAMAVGGSAILAEELGVAKSTLNKWANGVHRVPRLVKKEIRRLCRQHQISLPNDWE